MIETEHSVYTETELIALGSDRIKEIHRRIESGEIELVTPDDLP